MIGIVIVTHCRLGDALIEAAGFILGDKPEALLSVSIDITKDVDKLREKIAREIKKVGKPDGALVLTDMFGGTPSNLSYSFLEESRVEVISGVNLPILIQAINKRKDMDLNRLAAYLEDSGKKSIQSASGILKGNKRG